MQLSFKNATPALALVLFLLIPKVAKACSCTDYNVPVCEVFWSSAAVFTGSVTEITDVAGGGDGYSVIHFKVEQAFRGVVNNKLLKSGDNIEVLAPEHTSCAMGFKAGEQWLIYANRTTGGGLVTGPCNRTRPLPATEDMSYIMGLSEKSPKQSILGRVGRTPYEPVDGVKVIVEDRSNKYEAATDNEGKFKFDLPQPGPYKVRLFIPYSAMVLNLSGGWAEVESHPTEKLTTAEYAVNLEAGRCDYRSLAAFEKDLKATASIEGKVIDADGRPVAGQRVYLFPATADQDFSDRATLDVETDKDGNYKLGELREGRYWLGANLGHIPEADEPYPATLYPGEQEKNKATVITLKQGQKLSNKDIRLPMRLAEREITGRIVWPDGQPALAPSPDSKTPGLRPDLHVRDPKRLWYPINPNPADGRHIVSVDEGGRFSFIGLEGVTYVIWANASDARNEQWHSKPIRLSVKGEVKPLVLTLSLRGPGNSKELEKELTGEP